MTKTMKPRAIYTARKADQVTEICIAGTWIALPKGTDGMSLIGSSKWTICNAQGEVVARCSGNQEFQVR